MYCSNCGTKLEEELNFCSNCGNSLKKISPDESPDVYKQAEKKEEKIIKKIEDKDKVDFFIVPVGRLILFSILSFGFYSLYWFSKNFYAIKNRRKLREKETKEWWGIFNFITSNVLFSEFYLIYEEATGKKFKVPSWVFSLLYFVLTIVGLLFLFSPIIFIVTILIFQSMLKKYEYLGFFNYKKSKFENREILIVLVGIALLALSFWSQFNQSTVDTVNNTNLTYSDLKEVADYANKDLPKMLDVDTRFDNINPGEDNLTYNYTFVNYNKSDLVEGFLNENLKSDLVYNICKNPDMKIFRDSNTIFYYQYFDMNNNLIEKISIYPEADCAMNN